MNQLYLVPPIHQAACTPCTDTLLLIRHTEVDSKCRGMCYGSSDVPLSAAGRQQMLEIAASLAHLPIARVLHSGLQRTAALGTVLAEQCGCVAESEAAIRERDFGCWELRSWNEVYRHEGNSMMGMVTDPAGFRPGGGETTHELSDRVWDWYSALPRGGLTVAVTHGGPIAALLGRQQGLPVSAWLDLVPPCGGMVWRDFHTASGERR